MAEFLAKLLESMWATEISRVFSVLIIAAFVLSLAAIFRAKTDDRFPLIRTIPAELATSMVNLGPGILTSLGILGTFAGIFNGLVDFDLDNIDSSVPTLIEGLKLAFGTSILGLSTALIIRGLRSFAFPEVNLEDDGEDEFLVAIRKLIDAIDRNRRSTEKGFKSLESNVRQDIAQQTNIITNLSTHLTKNFSQEVITNFHRTLIEFNTSVKKLLEWQENYNEHIATLSNVTNRMARDMDVFNEATKKLHEQIIEIHKGLQSLDQLRDRAEGFVPTFSKLMEEVTRNLASMSEKLVDDHKRWIEEVNKVIKLRSNSEK